MSSLSPREPGQFGDTSGKRIESSSLDGHTWCQPISQSLEQERGPYDMLYLDS